MTRNQGIDGGYRHCSGVRKNSYGLSQRAAPLGGKTYNILHETVPFD